MDPNKTVGYEPNDKRGEPMGPGQLLGWHKIKTPNINTSSAVNQISKFGKTI